MRVRPGILLVLLVASALTWPGEALGAAGENGRIAFVSDRDGNAEIYTAEPAGSDQRRLTSNLVADTDPAWSPDGTRIAFTRQFDIWVMNGDGTDQHRITDEDGPDSAPAWSPDGTKLVFISNRNTPGGGTTGPELWVMNDDGTGVRQVTDMAASALAPAWSPVGASSPSTATWTGSSRSTRSQRTARRSATAPTRGSS